MIQPVQNFICVEIDPSEHTTSSGLVVQGPTEDVRRGKVAVTGSAAEIVKEGDLILFQKFGGVSAEFEGKTYIIIKDTDVLAVIRD